MAVSDIVSATYTSITTFQPAATVQICITQFISDTNLTNGIRGLGNITTANNMFFSTSAGDSASEAKSAEIQAWNSINRNFFIDNSSYLSFRWQSGSLGFSGLQTQ